MIATILPDASQKAIDRGISVSFIQKDAVVGCVQTNAIPASGLSVRRPINPLSLRSLVSAISTCIVTEPVAFVAVIVPLGKTTSVLSVECEHPGRNASVENTSEIRIVLLTTRNLLRE